MIAVLTAYDILSDMWWIGALALAVSLVLTPVVRLIAYRAKIVDRPDALLKPHDRPIAYMGGVAMCIGLLAGLAGYACTMSHSDSTWARLAADLASMNFPGLHANMLWQIMMISIACVVITVVGLVDDILNITPRAKICGQVLAATLLLFAGIGHRLGPALLLALHIPLLGEGWEWVMFCMSAAMCVVMVIATCNATNLLDGLDGLCGGVTGIVALGFLALGVCLATYLPTYDRFTDTTDQLRVALCLAMVGGVLGFLPYNIPPASIFMGDAGSMLLGFFVATAMAMFSEEGHARWLVAAMAVFALPILDTALAVVRRIVSGKGIFTGDRSHLYDQLVDKGMTVKQVVVLFYILSILAAFIGVGAALLLRARYAMALYAALLVVIWTVFYKKGMIAPDKHDPSPPPADKGTSQGD